ncbi:hypothetical protein N7456_011121 [Penicillium angulare]|uniref:Uncharacterized protein n=1 Tax=Penicillium angulare TaxID=116970 RepID=A0A9W9ETE1_9EURO|nr:hypothetical protein N7456_011121 [Penicillium angulare]
MTLNEWIGDSSETGNLDQRKMAQSPAGLWRPSSGPGQSFRSLARFSTFYYTCELTLDHDYGLEMGIDILRWDLKSLGTKHATLFAVVGTQLVT